MATSSPGGSKTRHRHRLTFAPSVEVGRHHEFVAVFVGDEGWTVDGGCSSRLRRLQALAVLVDLPQQLCASQLLERVDTWLDASQSLRLVVDDVSMKDQWASVCDQLVDDHVEVCVWVLGDVDSNHLPDVLRVADNVSTISDFIWQDYFAKHAGYLFKFTLIYHTEVSPWCNKFDLHSVAYTNINMFRDA